jgi:hypothetical protein
MRRSLAAASIGALVASTAACSHSPFVTNGLPAYASPDRCFTVELAEGAIADGHKCVSLDWTLAAPATPHSRTLRLKWTGNCFDAAAKAHWTEDADEVRIAVTVLEPYPLPNVGCPAFPGHTTVNLARALAARHLTHEPVTAG